VRSVALTELAIAARDSSPSSTVLGLFTSLQRRHAPSADRHPSGPAGPEAGRRGADMRGDRGPRAPWQQCAVAYSALQDP
jgi:hypothetical protein